jgi:superfamily II DNA or RNA helicase
MKYHCDESITCNVNLSAQELWIHGPPGAGKTVAALEIIRELVSRGCARKEVLYIAENPLLCAYIR